MDKEGKISVQGKGAIHVVPDVTRLEVKIERVPEDIMAHPKPLFFRNHWDDYFNHLDDSPKSLE